MKADQKSKPWEVVATMQIEARLMESFAKLDLNAWKSIYGDAPEGFEYFLACENATPPSFKLSAIAAFADAKPLAGAPIFKTAISLDLVLDGVARSLVRGLGKILPAMSVVPIFGIGTPYSHDSNLTFSPRLDAQERLELLAHLLDALEAESSRQKADIVLLKDVSATIKLLADATLRKRGYARITALPIATLRIPASEEAYFSSISGNMRSNMRRRLKLARNLRVEMRTSCDGIEDELLELRINTMQRAATDYDVFEEISPAYFREVLRSMGDNARLLTYWLDDVLLGFSLVLIGREKLIQTYNGMRYPQGPDNGLFYLDWMTQVRLCIAQGIPIMQSGVTTYLIKARLGCEFHRSHIYVRHHNSVINAIIRYVSPFINLEKSDPGLKELGSTAPFV